MYFSFFFWGMGGTGNFDRHCVFGVTFNLRSSKVDPKGVMCKSQVFCEVVRVDHMLADQ